MREDISDLSREAMFNDEKFSDETSNLSTHAGAVQRGDGGLNGYDTISKIWK